MYNMYDLIEELCQAKNIKVGKMCADLKISRGIMGDLKAGRTKTLSAQNLAKIAEYFEVSTDYLLNGSETKKTPTGEGERAVSDDDIMFALWGDANDIDKDDLEDVKRYAAFVRERKKKK